MDELDLLLETMDADKAEPDAKPEDYAELALQEFTDAKNPADRLEALKLLIRLSK